MKAVAIIPHIIDRHAEDAAFLWLLRDAAVCEPHYDLNDLAELDNRLAAHLDGLLIAGEGAWPAVMAGLKIGEPGEVFVGTWLAVALQDGIKLEESIEVARKDEENYRALVSAFAWHSWEQVEPWVDGFLRANNSGYQTLAVNICALHRQRVVRNQPLNIIEVVTRLQNHSEGGNPSLIARCLRAVGELGCQEYERELVQFCKSDIFSQQFWAAWSLVLLGNRSQVPILVQAVHTQNEFSLPALNLLVCIQGLDETRSLLKQLAQNEQTLRLAIQGAGYSGDPYWITGLLKMMENPEMARVAGEAISSITGLDLAYLDLDADWPDGFEAGPTEDPKDEDVEMDADESLPWPNPEKLTQWWNQNMGHYQEGTRYLLGQPISKAQCLHTLRKGYQRQRSSAALELACIREPLIETRAPGFTQKKSTVY